MSGMFLWDTVYNDNNKQTFFVKFLKVLQTNTAVNSLYDTKLCGSNTV